MLIRYNSGAKTERKGKYINRWKNVFINTKMKDWLSRKVYGLMDVLICTSAPVLLVFLRVFYFSVIFSQIGKML